MARRRRRSGGTYTAKASSTQATASNIGAVVSSQSKMPELDTYWYLFQKHPWVGSCVNLIANTVAADGYSVQKAGASNSEDISNDARVNEIDEFWQRAFVNGSYRRAMFAVAVDLSVFGRGYWRKKRMGRKMVFLERIDPRLVLPKPNADRTAIESFMLRKVSGGSDLASMATAQTFIDAEPIPADDIVFFKRGGGDTLLGAPSPLEHLDVTLGLDLAIRKHRSAFFKNGAVTGMVIAVPGATQPQMDAMMAMVKSSKAGPDNAYKSWLFATPKGEKPEILSRGTETAGGKDVDFLKGSAMNREEVCAVYHVPVGKISFSANSLGSSGKAEDDATFQEQCVLPLEEEIFETINREVFVKEFKIKDIEMAPQRRHALRFDMFDAAEKGKDIGLTGNELRALVNLSPIDDPEMNKPRFSTLTAPEAPDTTTTSGSGASNGKIADATDEHDKQDEVAQKGSKRFRQGRNRTTYA